MKKYLLFIAVLLFTGSRVFSQGTTVTVYSANGEKFILEVNSSKQNSSPETRVVAENVGGPMVKIKVYMEDSGIPPVSKSTMNKPGGDFMFVIEKDAKGKYALKATDVDQPSTTKEETKGESKEAKADGKSGTTAAAATTTEKKGDDSKGKSTKTRCENPLNDGEFYSSREMISHAPFDPPKLSNAKNLSKGKCLTSQQVREVIYIFSSEKTKLDYAKYAYDYVYDPSNYEEVYGALRDKSVEELKKYIESK